MAQTRNQFIKKPRRGPKPIILEMTPHATADFPGIQLQSVRNALTALSKQHPDRKYQYEIVNDKVIVTCLK